MTAAAEKFMQTSVQKPEALPWLVARPKTAAPDWVCALRDTGAESFAATGLPAPNWEGWQYTSLRLLSPEHFVFPNVNVFDANLFPAPLIEDSYRIVLVNGQMQAGLSRLPQGVDIIPLLQAEGVEEYLVSVGDLATQPFKALNSAYLRDGFVLRVAKGQELDRPLEVLFYTQDGAASHPRVLYQFAENSGATVIERHMGNGRYFANTHAEVVQAADSRLTFYRFVEEADAACHYSQVSLTLAKNAQFEGFSGAFSGALVRQECRMKLLERGVSCKINGIYLLRGRQSHDFTILADHFDESGHSAQHFKGVIDDQARAIFQGKIHVRRPAQKTDGYQSHHALLLSQDAENCAKPELEIYADDVKCSHGATSGQLDEAALFYLRSRGIPLNEARALLIRSFLHQNIEKIQNEKVHGLYAARIDKWLACKGNGA